MTRVRQKFRIFVTPLFVIQLQGLQRAPRLYTCLNAFLMSLIAFG